MTATAPEVTAPAADITEPTKPVKRNDPKRSQRRAAKPAKAATKAKAKKPTASKRKTTAKAPKVTGLELKSEMIRVSYEFAEWLRAESKKTGVPRADITRTLVASGILDK